MGIKIKLILVGLCILAIAVFINENIKTRPVKIKPGQIVTVQTVKTTVTVPNDVQVVQKPKVVVTTINKRGDKQIEPMTVIISKNGEEIPVLITVNDRIVNVLSTWKLATYGAYREGAVYGCMGIGYEVYHFGDFNLGCGIGTSGIMATVGYNIRQNTEGFIGWTSNDAYQSPIFGLSVRF